ncbi:LOW QUALITY PROTEIN: uncharacterized protein LOC129584999 [Paramacrobiotus metropolitanus]|uniref:LOW QUALITY PROTEIN: uncharacterized protein LOC129584999 n=1 Tax=Paramacrobiotus metropolitanus TaxID=2943436 RepID=UPI002445DF8D|nr:LOW QUALITY PROTEIN: uncharacterized protein LOC129584999 [Paramacrobiotus metropolitanus]
MNSQPSKNSAQADKTAAKAAAATSAVQRHEAPNAFPFLDSACRVCKSPSTGVHYGVATCEGCKGFFKRSIPKSQHYKCYFGGDCEINRETRNRCKACRFQRCVQVGMALEAVKMGRIPKGEKERAMRLLEASEAGISSEERPTKCLKDASTSRHHRQLDTVIELLPLSSPISSAPIMGTSIAKVFPPSNPPSAPSITHPAFSSATDVPSVLRLQQSAKATDDVRNGDYGQEINHWLASLPSTSSLHSPVKRESVECYGGSWYADNTMTGQKPMTSHAEIPSGHPKLVPYRSHPVPTSSFSGGEAVNISRSEAVKRREIARSLSDGPRTVSSVVQNTFRSVHSPLDTLHLPTSGATYSQPDLMRLCISQNDTERDLFGQCSPAPSSLSLPLTPLTHSGNQACGGGASSSCMSITDSGFGSRPESTFTSCNFDIDLTDDQSFPDLNSTAAVASAASGPDHFNQGIDSFNHSWMKCDPVGQQPAPSPHDSLSSSRHLNGTLLSVFANVADKDRAALLDDVVVKIDRVGNDVYQQDTSDSVEFMVKMWQEGRLNGTERINDPDITVLVIRDHIKISLDRIVSSIMQFASGLPGTTDLPETDFQRLLEQCVFEIWMIQYAAFLVNNESYIMLRSPERTIQYNRYWMSQFLPERMIDSIMKFADEINPCQFTFLELNILKAIVIACPYREGLGDAKNVHSLRNLYQHTLYQVFKRRGTALIADEMMANVNVLMPKLTALNELHKKCIAPIVLDKDEQWKVDENNYK